MENSKKRIRKNEFNVSSENDYLRIYIPSITGNNHYSKVLLEIGRALCNLDNPSEVVIQVTNTPSETVLLAATLSRLANEIKPAEQRIRNN